MILSDFSAEYKDSLTFFNPNFAGRRRENPAVLTEGGRGRGRARGAAPFCRRMVFTAEAVLLGGQLDLGRRVGHGPGVQGQLILKRQSGLIRKARVSFWPAGTRTVPNLSEQLPTVSGLVISICTSDIPE